MVGAEPCPVPFEDSLRAFEEEAAALQIVLDAAAGPWHERPTRLGGWRLAELTAHLVRGVTRVSAYLDQGTPTEPEIDWLGYWRRVNQGDPAEVAARAVESAARQLPQELVAGFAAGWRVSLARAHEEGADRVLPTICGPMRLDHYVTTRVLELTVHGLDVRDALALPAAATGAGLQVTCAVLEGLLGSERPADLVDDVAFVLAATGRVPHPHGAFPVLR